MLERAAKMYAGSTLFAIFARKTALHCRLAERCGSRVVLIHLSFTCACESGVSMIHLCGPLAALARPSQRPASRREPARRSFSRRRFRSRGYRGDDDTWRGPRASRARAAGPRTRTPRSVEGLPRHVPRTQCRRARSISSSAGVRTRAQASQPAPQFSKTFLIKRRHGSRTDIPRSRHIHT